MQAEGPMLSRMRLMRAEVDRTAASDSWSRKDVSERYVLRTCEYGQTYYHGVARPVFVCKANAAIVDMYATLTFGSCRNQPRAEGPPNVRSAPGLARKRGGNRTRLMLWVGERKHLLSSLNMHMRCFGDN
jgi:hypothetical protein